MTAATFRYRAVDRAGAPREGVAQAASRAEAYRKVAASGLTPISITAERPRAARGRKIGLLDIAQFTYQLGVLISARIPIGEGLRSIAEQEPNPRLQGIVSSMADRIEAGDRIAEAMEVHRAVFGEVYLEAVRAAEQSGNMHKVLEYLSDMLERQQETRQQIRGAFMYPTVVISVLLVAVVFLISYVIPTFAKMFRERGVELPVFTRVLVAVGDSVSDWWFVYAGTAAVAAWALRRAWRVPRGRAVIEGWLHAVPVVKRILVGTAIARFARLLGLCLSSGLGLLESLEMAGRGAARARLAADVAQLSARVRAGGRLSEGLSSCTYLTPFAKRMVSAGEESGELTRLCGVVARQYEREATATSKNLSTVIEPLLVVAIAAVVLVVALAIFLPMWNLVSIVG